MYFSGTEWRRKARVRPLRVISDFVTERMPLALASPDDTFARELLLVAGAMTPGQFRDNLAVPDEHLSLACLDLAILKQACGHTNATLPPSIELLLTTLCQRGHRLATLLYEDCVVANPVEIDPRLFSAGEAAAHERDFLQLHRCVESALDDIIEQLQQLSTTADAGGAVAACNAATDTAMDCFKWFRQMPPGAFECFRRFYGAPEGGPHPGVGGRFSGTIATLRLLLDGSRIVRELPGYAPELLVHAAYYPARDRTRMLAALQCAVIDEASPIDALCRDNEATRALVARLRSFLDTCAGIHYRLVKQFVLDPATAAAPAAPA